MRCAPLLLQVLGSGTLTKSLNVHAGAFSESAKAKITEAGGKTEPVAGPKKWTKKGYKRMVAEMTAAGKDYKAERLKKRIENLKAKGMFTERTAKPAKAGATKAAAKKN